MASARLEVLHCDLLGCALRIGPQHLSTVPAHGETVCGELYQEEDGYCAGPQTKSKLGLKRPELSPHTCQKPAESLSAHPWFAFRSFLLETSPSSHSDCGDPHWGPSSEPEKAALTLQLHFTNAAPRSAVRLILLPPTTQPEWGLEC